MKISRLLVFLLLFLSTACAQSSEDKVKSLLMFGAPIGDSIDNYSHAQMVKWRTVKRDGTGEETLVSILLKEGHAVVLRFMCSEEGQVKSIGGFFSAKNGHRVILGESDPILYSSIMYRLAKDMPILEKLEDNNVHISTMANDEK